MFFPEGARHLAIGATTSAAADDNDVEALVRPVAPHQRPTLLCMMPPSRENRLVAVK